MNDRDRIATLPRLDEVAQRGYAQLVRRGQRPALKPSAKVAKDYLESLTMRVDHVIVSRARFERMHTFESVQAWLRHEPEPKQERLEFDGTVVVPERR